MDGLGRVRRVLTVLIHREQVSSFLWFLNSVLYLTLLYSCTLDYLQLFVLSFLYRLKHEVLQVEEYFDEFRCQCDAWSSLGQTSSKVATVNTGCKLYHHTII